MTDSLKDYSPEEKYVKGREINYSIPLPPQSLAMPEFISDEGGVFVPPKLDSLDWSDFESEGNDYSSSEGPIKILSFNIPKDIASSNAPPSLLKSFNPSVIKDYKSILTLPPLKEKSSFYERTNQSPVERYFIEEYAMAFDLPLNANKKQILSKVDQYSIYSYAKTHFRKHHLPNFNMKYYTTEELTSFSDKPLYKMLLKKMPDEKKELGKAISFIILRYAKVIESEKIDLLPGALVSALRENNDAIDETYFQLIKYSNNTPDRNILAQIWKLWIIISSLFPASEDVRPYIFAFLIRIIYKYPDPLGNLLQSHSSNKSLPAMASEGHDDIKDTNLSGNSIYQTDNTFNQFAKFVFMRLFERSVKIGLVHTKDMTKEVFMNMPKVVRFGRSMFSCSLYEVMWCQKRFYPLLPVPLPLYLVLNQIKKNGGFLTPDFLVLKNRPESRSIMNLWLEKLPFDNAIINDGEINELVALLFYFLFNITDSIIPKVCADVFIEKCQSQNYSQIFRYIPLLHLNTLKYLIGFLQEVNSFEQYNKMTKDHIAEIFSKFFVETHKKIIEPFKRYKMNELCNGFIVFCIENLDCTEVYPLEPEWTKRVELNPKKPVAANAAVEKQKNEEENDAKGKYSNENRVKNNENKNSDVDKLKEAKDKQKDKRKEKSKDKYKSKDKNKIKNKNKNDDDSS